MKLSNQAMGALMMALQKSLLEQTDIVPTLQSFNFKVNKEEQLEVENPPTFRLLESESQSEGFQHEQNETTGSD